MSTSSTAVPPRSPAIDPADPAAHAPRPPSQAALGTQAQRDAAARAAGRDTDANPRLTPEQAKMLLLDAARAFDPLKAVREHPYVTVGTAAGVGVVLGSSGATLLALTALTKTATSMLRPLSGILGQYAMTRLAAGQAVEADNDQASNAGATDV